MPKQDKVYIDDILEAILAIEDYTKGIVFERFSGRVKDATLRNLEIIGEAAKNLPPEAKKTYPDVEWKKISGLRDILIHAYSGVDLKIIWDVVKNKLPELKKALRK